MRPNSKSQAQTKADSKQKVDDMQVSQHNAKPNVVGSQSQFYRIKNAFTNEDDFWIEYTPKSPPVEKR
jgi:hypothetical protein